ncbi:dual specificity protein phosphatase 19 [Anaeramoeba flamelloides]|uniref:protein-tyrosine-phosphatase n=1 Tax=Anaeramoeba flamelloides TaxID=1746091 RepID=A0ABQ8XIH4_9EUKA|nr:dual specificity protein phosphatase 19 [Anaeramoeba flamelloides]
MGNTIDPVDHGLFLGNAKGSCDKELLKKHNITHIINVCYEPNRFPKDFVYYQHKLYDSNAVFILSEFPKFISFIGEALKKKGNNVFVHCEKGVSRSATVVLAYIMYKYQINCDQAYQFVQENRPEIQPNKGFIQQLRLWGRLRYNLNGTSKCHQEYQNLCLINNAFKCFGKIETIDVENCKSCQIFQDITKIISVENGFISQKKAKKLNRLTKKKRKKKKVEELISNCIKLSSWPDYSVSNWENNKFYQECLLPIQKLVK